MVRIIDYKQREKDGETFFVLVLQGKPEIVKSLNTGKSYMTVRQAFMPCTFDEEMCRALIGETFVGSIKRVPCEEYEYTTPDSGEIIKLDFRYEYSEEAETTEEAVFERV